MLSNLVSKTVAAGQVLIVQVDGQLTEHLAGDVVLLTAWDAVVFTAAGLVS